MAPHSFHQLRPFSVAFVAFDRDTLPKQMNLLAGCGQTHRQVFASGLKSNLRRDLLGGQTDSQVSSQLHASRKKTF